MTISESELIEGCIRQDRKSQELLYRTFSKKMFGVCLGYSKDYDNAKDVLQEGFIKVFHSINDFTPGNSLEGWIRRIIVHTAIDHYRRTIRLLKSTTELDDDDLEPVENHVLAKIDEQELLNVIRELPEGYRLIMNLYAVEGYTHKEIGEMLNISEGTSKSQLFYAKRALKKRIISNFGVDYYNGLNNERLFQVV